MASGISSRSKMDIKWICWTHLTAGETFLERRTEKRLQTAWIGLFYNVKSWSWSMSDSAFYQHKDFSNWGSNQPDNHQGTENCGEMYSDGYWNDDSCLHQQESLCSNVSANSSSQFIFINEAKNWTEAQSYCREHDADLAIIKNMEDMKTLLNEAKSLGLTYAIWIGLYDDVNSWKWSMSDSDFYQQDEKEFRNWASGQPNNLNGQQYCTEMYYGGIWNDRSCSYEQHFICSDVNGANVRFVYINIKMSWTEAQSYCRKHHTDLASVRNMAENRQVVNVRPVPSKLAWIGLYRVPWKWVDGSNSSFRNWNEEPTLNEEDKCAAANFGKLGKWEGRKCDEKKPFFCYGVPFAENVMAVMQLKVSSANVTESAVRDDLLNQVRQKLKELRVDADLTWRKPLDKKAIEEQEKEENKKRNDEF